MRSRKKGVLSVARKREFEEQIQALSTQAKSLNEKLPEFLMGEILEAKKRIRAELERFLHENPPDHLKKFKNESLFAASIGDVIGQIVSSLRFPSPELLADRISLAVHY